jgi:hypothetical protein
MMMPGGRYGGQIISGIRRTYPVPLERSLFDPAASEIRTNYLTPLRV